MTIDKHFSRDVLISSLSGISTTVLIALYQVIANYPSTVTIRDFTRDGLKDVIVETIGGDTSYHINNGSGEFVRATRTQSSGNTYLNGEDGSRYILVMPKSPDDRFVPKDGYYQKIN